LTGTWPLTTAVVAFVLAAAAIALSGTRLSLNVDRLADRTGLGEAMAGAVLLGGATSLAGLVVSISAAVADQPSLAVSNSLGGIAVQTAFIVVADLFYRRANLEHAAASLTNVFNVLLMIALLAIVATAASGPAWTIAGIHPASPILIGAYLYGLSLARRVGAEKMWEPRRTTETRNDVPDEWNEQTPLGGIWIRFAAFGSALALSGWVLAQSGTSIAARTGLSGTLVGAFMTSIATSLPELVTAVAAVRAGALTLAVGGILGGNAFDVLFIAFADGSYRGGSIYAAMTSDDLFVLGWTTLLVTIAGAGLVRRSREGIGFEGVAIIVVYLVGLAAVAMPD
jgi:cation:H+ antiporter